MKRSEQAWLIYVNDTNCNIPTTWRWALRDKKGSMQLQGSPAATLSLQKTQFKIITYRTDHRNNSFFSRTIRDWNNTSSMEPGPAPPLDCMETAPLNPILALHKSLPSTNSDPLLWIFSCFSAHPPRVAERSTLTVVTWRRKGRCLKLHKHHKSVLNHLNLAFWVLLKNEWQYKLPHVLFTLWCHYIAPFRWFSVCWNMSVSLCLYGPVSVLLCPVDSQSLSLICLEAAVYISLHTTTQFLTPDSHSINPSADTCIAFQVPHTY